MRTGKTMPEAKIFRFELNPINGWYCQTDGPPGFSKVPAELKVEETRRPDIIRANLVIHSRQKDGRYSFFTGLIPAGFDGLYFGDVYEFRNGKKINSFCLFLFSGASQKLEVHLFNGFKLYPNRRRPFINDYWRAERK